MSSIPVILARKYSIAVRQSRHPKVCDCIIQLVDAIKSVLLELKIQLIAVVIFDKDDVTKERFSFDVSELSAGLEAWSAALSFGSQLDDQRGILLQVVDMEE